MGEKAIMMDLKPKDAEDDNPTEIQLNSGRQVVVHSGQKEELIEIMESEGEVVMKIRMTDAGPVVSVHGAHLELKATETISMEAKKIKVQAEEEAVLESKGRLKMNSSEELDINSDDHIRINGKMIYLN